MIVHIIGGAGTGKSTLINKLVSDHGFERSARPMGVVSYWRLLLAFLQGLPDAFYLASANRIKKTGPSFWKWSVIIALQKVRQGDEQSKKILLVDQGLSFILNKHGEASIEERIRRLPLPDMVVNVSAPPAVRAARVALRYKPEHPPRRYLSREEALQTGGVRARQWNALWGKDEALRCLQAWNQRQCRPEIKDLELENLLQKAIGQPLTDRDEAALQNTILTARSQWLKEAYKRNGVCWLDVTNDGSQAVADLASFVAAEILSVYSTLQKAEIDDGC